MSNNPDKAANVVQAPLRFLRQALRDVKPADASKYYAELVKKVPEALAHVEGTRGLIVKTFFFFALFLRAAS